MAPHNSSDQEHRHVIDFDNIALLSKFCGPNNAHINALETMLGVSVFVVKNSIELFASDSDMLRDCKKLCEYLITCINKSVAVTEEFIRSAIYQLRGNAGVASAGLYRASGHTNTPRTLHNDMHAPDAERQYDRHFAHKNVLAQQYSSHHMPTDERPYGEQPYSDFSHAGTPAAQPNHRPVHASANRGYCHTPKDARSYSSIINTDCDEDENEPIDVPTIVIPSTKKQIIARTAGQATVIRALRQFELSFLIGPAGTGKTFLATAYAVSLLFQKKAKRFVITRPVVEAGEQLGFLPGDLDQKILPYLRPVYDALEEVETKSIAQYLQGRGKIEIAPLAYMRGRTLRQSVVLLDEAQNCTVEQMKMFLTRIGRESVVIVTGDLSQSDLKHKPNGLQNAAQVFADTPRVGMVRLSYRDVQRSEIAKIAIEAYNAYNGVTE